MHDSRQQRLLRLLRQRLVTLALLVFVLLWLPSVWGAYSKERESRENRIEAEKHLAQLQVRERTLQTEVEHLKTERGMEAAFRHQYDVGASGEGVIYIVEREAPTTSVTEVDPNPVSRWFKSWWPFW